LKKNVKNEIEVHYLFMETKISAIRHKLHFKIHFEFKPWDGRRMVNTKFVILYYSLKSKLKCNKLILIEPVHSNLLTLSFRIKIN